VLVVVGGVEHQQHAARRFRRRAAAHDLHRLLEVRIGRRGIGRVAIGERVGQTFDEHRLVGRRFVVLVGGHLLASSLRTEKEVGVDNVADERRETADLGRRLERVLRSRHRLRRLREIAPHRRVHGFRDRCVRG
jgi:hypothetical protein